MPHARRRITAVDPTCQSDIDIAVSAHRELLERVVQKLQLVIQLQGDIRALVTARSP